MSFPNATFDDSAPSGETPLSWRLADIERRCLFPAAPFTQVNTFFALLLGLIACAITYGVLIAFPNTFAKAHAILVERGGAVQCAVGVLFYWGMAILLIKWQKLSLQRRCLRVELVPEDPGFTLSPITAGDVLTALARRVDDPDAFILFNRIRRALTGMKNMGRVSDVNTVLQAQADGDANVVDASYSLIKAFCWAMPVLGFIGTVFGLSGAIGEFGRVVTAQNDLSKIKENLLPVTSSLAFAFEATLVSLTATLVLHMLMSLLRKKEDDFLLACDDYCHRNIVSKLRLLAYKEGE